MEIFRRSPTGVIEVCLLDISIPNIAESRNLTTLYYERKVDANLHECNKVVVTGLCARHSIVILAYYNSRKFEGHQCIVF